MLNKIVKLFVKIFGIDPMTNWRKHELFFKSSSWKIGFSNFSIEILIIIFRYETVNICPTHNESIFLRRKNNLPEIAPPDTSPTVLTVILMPRHSSSRGFARFYDTGCFHVLWYTRLNCRLCVSTVRNCGNNERLSLYADVLSRFRRICLAGATRDGNKVQRNSNLELFYLSRKHEELVVIIS